MQGCIGSRWGTRIPNMLGVGSCRGPWACQWFALWGFCEGIASKWATRMLFWHPTGMDTFFNRLACVNCRSAWDQGDGRERAILVLILQEIVAEVKAHQTMGWMRLYTRMPLFRSGCVDNFYYSYCKNLMWLRSAGNYHSRFLVQRSRQEVASPRDSAKSGWARPC